MVSKMILQPDLVSYRTFLWIASRIHYVKSFMESSLSVGLFIFIGIYKKFFKKHLTSNRLYDIILISMEEVC